MASITSSKQHYRIFLSKDDYEDIQTYPNPPDGGFTPIDADINVIESFLNTKTFFMDKSANLTLEAINIITNEGIEDIDFDLKGGKKIGINPETFNVKRTESTDSSGHAVFSNISPGSYSIENINSLDTSEYAFIGTDELIPFEISSEENHVIEFIFTNKNENSLVVLVKDQTTKETLSEASVKLTGGEFDQTVLTGETGIAFFPQSPDVLISGDYDLLVSIDGYSDYDESVEINDLVKKEVELAE